MRLLKCSFRSLLTRFEELEGRQFEISPEKNMGLLLRKVAQKRQKTQFFENSSFFFENFQKMFSFFFEKFSKSFSFCFEKFSKIFQIIFLIFFRNFSTWNLYISKIFKSLSSESFSNVLVRKPFGRDVRVWRTSVSKSFGLETYLEISIFFQTYKF